MISGTVAAYFTEVFARGERTNFWDENLNGNIDPFVEGEFFQLSWDKKVCCMSPTSIIASNSSELFKVAHSSSTGRMGFML